MTRNTIMWLLLYITSLPFELNGAPPLTEQALQGYLNRQIELMPRKRVTTLRSLYGDRVNVHNFNPGDQLIQMFNDHPDEIIRVKLSYTDTPESRAFDIHLGTTRIVDSRLDLIAIKGGPESGKTWLLRTLEVALHDQPEPILTVYTDLTNSISPDAPEVLNKVDLLRKISPAGVSDFVVNVAEVNPSRVRILMDNLDKISPALQQQVVTAISQLVEGNVHVMVTTSADIPRTLRQMNPTETVINPLSEMTFEELANNHWKQTLGGDFFQAHSERIRQYSKALRLMIFETPLPRFVGIAKRLLQVSNGLRPLPSLSEYIQHPDMYEKPRKLLQLSDHMDFDKAAFYRQLLPESATRGALPFYSEVYGAQALKMQLDPALPAELGVSIEQANTHIRTFGPEMYKLLKFGENRVPVDFFHPEYKRYFAAQHILNSFIANNPLTESFKTVMQNPSHSRVAEFIDSEMPRFNDHTDKIKTIFSEVTKSSLEVAYQIADNLIAHRFDNLCPKMLEVLHEQHHLNDYITDHQTVLESGNKYSFGMLSEVATINVDSHYRIPRKTPWIYKGNRMEMIVNLKLSGSRAILQRSGYGIDLNIDLIAAAKELHGLREFLQANREYKFTPEVLEKAMYDSIKALGPESIGNMELLEEAGARPRAINVEGRTLAHEAARWHNRDLLQVVYEKYKVQFYDSIGTISEPTILFELLDHALPSNHYVQKNAWESVAYLTEITDLSANEEIIKNNLGKIREYNPPLDSIDPSYQNLIARDPQHLEFRRDVVNTLEKYIPIEDVDVPREVLSIRRKLIMKNCVENMLSNSDGNQATLLSRRLFPNQDSVTVAELVLSHTPIEGSFEIHHYQTTVKNLLTKSIHPLNQFQLDRVSTIMIKNAHSAGDISQMIQMIRNDVLQREPNLLMSLKHAYDLRAEGRLSEPSTGGSFESRAVQTAYNLQPSIDYPNDIMDIAQIQQDFAGELSSSSSEDSDFDIYNCVD